MLEAKRQFRSIIGHADSILDLAIEHEITGGLSQDTAHDHRTEDD